MNRYERKERKLEEYGGLKLKLYLDSEQPYSEDNKFYYEKLKEALEISGFHMNINSDNMLTLEVSGSGSKFYNKSFRSAGRRSAVARKSAINSYDYADIVFMLNSMTDKTIIKEIGMAQATYYRHKKVLMTSKYYERLDKNKLKELEYLKGFPGNKTF